MMRSMFYHIFLLAVCIFYCGAAAEAPKIKFSDGNEIPIIGLGTWQSPPGQVSQAVKDAIDIGYRQIDCAHVYENEKEVGEGLKAKFDDGTVKRENMFITSKLWNTFHKPELVEVAINQTLKNLGLSYVDLYLIHWPVGFKEGQELAPRDSKGNVIFSDVDYVDTWKAMEEVHKKGLAKSIGLSNFNKGQIDRVLEIATVKPVNLQIECHPYLNQQKLINYCRSKGMTVTAYSPLGSPGTSDSNKDKPRLLNNLLLKSIGEKYHKTTAQVLIRYQIQRGIIVIPKSVTKSRIAENFNVFDFELSQEDMAAIDKLNTNNRYITFDPAIGHKYYPFLEKDNV